MGDGASSSSTKSPSVLSSSSPSGVSSEIGSLTSLKTLLELVERYLHLLGNLFRARLAAEALDQQARHAQQLIDRLDHVDRDTNRSALVGNRTRHRLPNPPRRVSRELEAALVIELHDRPHQADVAFLDKVKKTQATTAVALGKAHHQPQVAFGQLLLGAPALGLARRDRFERARKFVGRNLDPALNLLDRLLRRFDSRGDIEQVLAAAVDLQRRRSSASAASRRSCDLLRPVASS